MLPPMHPDDPEHVGQTERTRFWRTHEIGEIEWLTAEYRTHRFTRHWHETYALGTVEIGGETFMARGERHYVPPGSLICSVVLDSSGAPTRSALVPGTAPDR